MSEAKVLNVASRHEGGGEWLRQGEGERVEGCRGVTGDGNEG